VSGRQDSGNAISVALPALNAAATLNLAIRSLLWQRFDNWELLLMDDGSSDRTIEIAREFNDPRIQIVSDGVHLGLSAQLNRAVEMARGKYFARMDADDIAYPARLQKQFDFLESHPDIDLAGGSMAVFRSDETLLGLRRFPLSHVEICSRPWAGFPMAHPTWMGRVEWFRQNPYRTDAVRMEDQELLLRTHTRSRFANIPEVVLGYREDSLSLEKQLLARRNMGRFGARYGIEHKKFVLAGRAMASQAARAMLDILALSTGLGHKLLRYRALPPSPAEVEEWKRVWTAIASAPTEACAASMTKAATGEAQ
jgi:glycosyltransferase involved in cell wall biosynthesis